MSERLGPILRLRRTIKGKYRRSLKVAYLESGELLDKLKTIRHPNLMSIYEYDDDYVYVEFVDGLVLSNRHPNCPPQHTECFLDRVSAIDLAPIKSAIHYLHANGICHSDVNSHNILVTADGTLKLVDMICCLPRKKAFIKRDFEMFQDLEREIREDFGIQVRIDDHSGQDTAGRTVSGHSISPFASAKGRVRAGLGRILAVRTSQK